jgi:hypothetical protein
MQQTNRNRVRDIATDYIELSKHTRGDTKKIM